ncbi:MAG: DNA cytosine methyltransferase [Gammaproteobacteria bacterium]|nr:DNA cytosine methyltransferase [Gammaproteobacteria bacterium]
MNGTRKGTREQSGVTQKKKQQESKRATTFTYIDLFCGCGGFSLGLERAGLKCLAAVDHDPDAIATFKRNIPDVENALERDLTRFRPEDLKKIIGTGKVDIIVGGPPCQGFSRVRKVDGANHGSRMVEDSRRLLYKNYLHYVEFFQPSIFVMENVPGIRSAAGGAFFASVQADARKLGYRVHSAVIYAWHYGVPQKRERQLIIGTAFHLPMFSTNAYAPQTHEDPAEPVSRRRPKEMRKGRGRPRILEKPVTLWEAIGDLPPVWAGGGGFRAEYDVARGAAHLEEYGRRYLMDVLQVHKSEVLTAHVARPHSERDLRDFDRLHEGETSRGAVARGVEMEFPYDREHFKDRYTRQHRNGLCSTIVAHLSKDGLMFIHPTQRRSLTVREAARVQSFPDWFLFPESRTIAFRLVGNAVPPLLGEAIGRGLKKYLSVALPVTRLSPLPTSPEEAMEWLAPVVEAAIALQRLRALPAVDFKKAWFSIGYLHNWLHPDSATDSGNRVVDKVHLPTLLARLAPEIAVPAYECSGWPVRLVPVAREAARRFQEGLLRFDEYYCSQAQIAGWEWNTSNKGEKWGRTAMK